MWQLVLLSQVVPAFGALAKNSLEPTISSRISRDAQDCYSDIVNIAQTLSISRGEWAPGLKEEVLMSLLRGLEARFPKKRKWFNEILENMSLQGAESDHYRTKQFPRLSDVAKTIKTRGLGGFDACDKLLDRSDELEAQYLELFGRRVSLFNSKEKNSSEKRAKFLEKVQCAQRHLLEVYCPNSLRTESGPIDLHQHPSGGIKDLAEKVYVLLEQHWRCQCSQRNPKQREVRLNLTSHCKLALSLPSSRVSTSTYRPTKFEVLLPVCKDCVEWKVTNIEVKQGYPSVNIGTGRRAVNNDICEFLSQSDGFQVDFLAENDRFWHLSPRLSKDLVSHHTMMEPLDQLLGDHLMVSKIAGYSPREKLILCYILANSMLFLYPGSWFQNAWGSPKVYFTRRLNSSRSTTEILPYLSVQLQQFRNRRDPEQHHMQYHHHPAVLDLGIVLLEIATGTRVPRSHQPQQWERCKEDGPQALRHLQNYDYLSHEDPSKRISPTLKNVIQSCLTLEPPSTFPTNDLVSEGPIRHYILCCVVQPLAEELRHGYKESLEDLHQVLISNKESGTPDKDDLTQTQSSCPTRSCVPTAVNCMSRQTYYNFLEMLRTNIFVTHEANSAVTEKLDLCYFAHGGGMEKAVDEEKISSAAAWFGWHRDAIARIRSLRKPKASNDERVKIAILDTGIDILGDNEALYNCDPKIVYRDWIENDTGWQDADGHGTHLAVLLRKIAPEAAIHVARVFKKKPRIAASATIALAIQHAVDVWGVDMIVMSFGFGTRDPVLEKAIDHAISKKVLIFAAASNDGKNRPDGVAWPASKMGVFCVHSADGLGNPSPFTPSPRENMKIMVLGECVLSAWPRRLLKGSNLGDHKYMSGTSCATPIAAGIAAVVLDYARRFLTEDEWKDLRRYDSINRMFQKLSDTNSRSGYQWIRHWVLFAEDRDEAWIQSEIKQYLV
ncbi:hypothetical protein NM208_g304 [Fusarium decemcellulare]|uniref:Uncharacterized protein n=1 Tax=Fusarium decemcellulare TaxID=57161 RepID=A0ACC1T067_9HYPO|nr:hypothetical protein NM208_g304 [Fusarium decemcellulare]